MKGTHPQGAELSALEHLLDGAATIPADRGLLLDTTYRMHSSIATFVSGLSYDGRLTVDGSCDRQEVLSSSRLGGTGLRYIPVDHRHNSAASDEEAQVAGLVRDILEDGTWVNAAVRELRPSDVLVLAPFNAHVHKLRHRSARWSTPAYGSGRSTSSRARRRLSSSTRWPRPAPRMHRGTWSSSTA